MARWDRAFPAQAEAADESQTGAFGEFHLASLELFDVLGMDQQRHDDVVLEGVSRSMQVSSITAALTRCSCNQRTISARPLGKAVNSLPAALSLKAHLRKAAERTVEGLYKAIARILESGTPKLPRRRRIGCNPIG